jgi:hypothetical protein
MVGCADPAFQQYVANRQAAINTMHGAARENAQAQLDMAIMADKQRQQQQAAAAAVGIAGAALGVAGGIAAARSRPYYYPVPVYHPWYPYWY